jgi:hypothetical protein
VYSRTLESMTALKRSQAKYVKATVPVLGGQDVQCPVDKLDLAEVT